MSYDGGGKVVPMPRMPGWLKQISGGSILAVLAIIYLLTGTYQVDQGEVGVVRRFGAVTGMVDTGLHWHWPWPVETVTVISVDQVRRVEIGFKTTGKDQYTADTDEAAMLTGDENILHADMVVQFKVRDPAKYLFVLDNPELTVRDVAQAVLRQVVGARPIDEVLTTGKLEVQVEVLKYMQQILDRYDSGIFITNVNLQDVYVPEAVTGAFKEVVSAREEAVRATNEAEAYRNDIVPKARGEAERMLRQAEAYKAERVSRAEGDAAQFLSMLREYQHGKIATRTRLYLETMEQILPNVEVWVIDEKASSGVVPYLPLGREAR